MIDLPIRFPAYQLPAWTYGVYWIPNGRDDRHEVVTSPGEIERTPEAIAAWFAGRLPPGAVAMRVETRAAQRVTKARPAGIVSLPDGTSAVTAIEFSYVSWGVDLTWLKSGDDPGPPTSGSAAQPPVFRKHNNRRKYPWYDDTEGLTLEPVSDS